MRTGSHADFIGGMQSDFSNRLNAHLAQENVIGRG